MQQVNDKFKNNKKIYYVLSLTKQGEPLQTRQLNN